MDDGERAARQYDEMAGTYSAHNEKSTWNAYYERPATIALLGEVQALRVLEVGCGAGPLTEWLVNHGASVTALDVSPNMLELARTRLGNRARFVLGTLEEPLGFAPTGSIDLVVASLVLHYVRDWEPVFAEFHRVLAPGGHVVFSTHHPAMDWQTHSPDDYFAIRQVTETWVMEESHDVTFWRRPLTAMTSAITSAGFLIEQLVEPPADPALAAIAPEDATWIATQPNFLFFRLVVRAA